MILNAIVVLIPVWFVYRPSGFELPPGTGLRGELEVEIDWHQQSFMVPKVFHLVRPCFVRSYLHMASGVGSKLPFETHDLAGP